MRSLWWRTRKGDAREAIETDTIAIGIAAATAARIVRGITVINTTVVTHPDRENASPIDTGGRVMATTMDIGINDLAIHRTTAIETTLTNGDTDGKTERTRLAHL